MTVFNDILIPRLKEAFTPSYVQAMLVQFAFFGACFVGSFIYFTNSVSTGSPIAKLGHKNGVVIGLLISANGAACASGKLFVPGPYCANPLISTGAGGNFGAGCLTAAFEGLDDAGIVLAANYASGHFVRSGRSGSFANMAKPRIT